MEKLFRETFLASAPLYSAASKIKLPYEDLKTTTTLYRGSLTDEMRTVEQICNFKNYKDAHDTEDLKNITRNLATEAGHLVDGLIRMEHGKNRDGGDLHNTQATRVIDVFEHADGRPNLNFMYVTNTPTMDPGATLVGWIAYRFYFACARIRQEYKHATTKSL